MIIIISTKMIKIKDKNFIHKIDLINKEYLFKTAINIDELFSITVWNKNYLLLFEKFSENIHLFNTKTFRIVNKFINVDGDVYIGKKLTINNEELLFVNDLEGIIIFGLMNNKWFFFL